MEFEEQIKILANEIYEKVVKFVCENKDNDDILYEYAYLTLSNGLQLMFRFDNDELYVTKRDAVGYDMFFPYKVKITSEDTEYKSKIIYGTSLNKQNDFTDKEKVRIIEFYKKLNVLVDNLTYNIKKTRNVDNYNYDTLDVYNEYMHKKELSKLEETQDTILPAVKVAVDWWAKIISGKIRGGSIGNDTDSKTFMTGFDIVYPKESKSHEQINKFKEILAQKIMDKIYESDEVIQMICDYGPDRLLYDAMIASGINTRRTPFKTNMYIRAYLVVVKEGFGARDVTLFDSTEESDIENVKNICCHDVQIEQAKTLRKNNQ